MNCKFKQQKNQIRNHLLFIKHGSFQPISDCKRKICQSFRKYGIFLISRSEYMLSSDKEEKKMRKKAEISKS